ncbi:MAG: hypothetical protein IKB34_06790 [Clostridia bacterium]|nr:hypothetical protein [Clostridia bacterium]
MPTLIFWIAVAVFDHSMQTAVALLAALLHELGHIVVIRTCGMHLTGLTVLPYGLEMTTDRPPCTFYEDIAVNVSGCAVNFLAFPIFYTLGAVIHGDLGYFLLLFSVSSLTLGFINALPVATLDGGCALEALLSLFFAPDLAYRVVRVFSFFTLVILWIAATYVFMFSGYNYSLFAMAVWLFVRLFCAKD